MSLAVVLSAAAPSTPDFERMVDSNVIVGGNCSGTHIGDGKILTAWHCVRFLDPGQYTQISKKEEGQHWDSVLKIHGYVEWKDKATDLAILSVRDHSIFAVAPVCYRDAVLGEEVYAFGNPAMQHDSLLKGIVSKVIRKIDIGGDLRTYFQLDAGLVGGISGGATYDSTGCLIGVNAAGIPGTVIGASVPVTFLPEEYR